MENAKFKMQTLKPAAAGKVVAFAFCILHLALILSGCAKAQANAVPDGPPLAVPAAPPRVIGPIADEPRAENPPEPETPPAPPPTNVGAPPRPRRPPTTTAATPAEEPKPETPAVTPPPVVEAPRPVPPQVDAVADRRIRDVMRDAASNLNRVDYRRLSTDGKAQYELSKRFNELAEQALKERNYVYAATVAEKAAEIATQLQGR
jgi:hypothetical protein